MSDPTKELVFQNEVIAQMLAAGWQRGAAEKYDRALALYPEDVTGFVKDTQPEQWQKFCALYPSNSEQKFLERVAEQLDKGRSQRRQPNLAHVRHAGRAAPRTARRRHAFLALSVSARERPQPRHPHPLRPEPPARGAGDGLQPMGERG